MISHFTRTFRAPVKGNDESKPAEGVVEKRQNSCKTYPHFEDLRKDELILIPTQVNVFV